MIRGMFRELLLCAILQSADSIQLTSTWVVLLLISTWLELTFCAVLCNLLDRLHLSSDGGLRGSA
jgi:hypothetical protein